MTNLTSPAQIRSKPEERCCFCNKKMKAPVTNYKRYGVEFITKGEKAHIGCVRREFKKIKKALAKTNKR